MIAIRSPADIEKARLPPHLEAAAGKHLRHIIDDRPQYDPDDDGHLVIVTPTDTDLNLGQILGRRWRESGFEGVWHDSASCCFVAVILRNNQHATTILIPDEPWLEPAIRQRLLLELPGCEPIAPLPAR